MRVAFINGSPRKSNSISLKLLRALEERLPGCEISRGWDTPGEAIVIAFPLYVDSLPSNLLRELEAHETGLPPGTPVYALANNGFYEGEQNAIAIAILRNWSLRAGLAWGQGAGLGGAMVSAEATTREGNIMRPQVALRGACSLWFEIGPLV